VKASHSLKGLALALAVAVGWSCSATSFHKVLTTLFDGVPPLATPTPRAAPAASGAAVGSIRQSGYREHGPYAARLCVACHLSGASNALVAPGEQLCLRCHELRLDKPYVHGPVLAGACVSCHDPHSSQYRYLLVSESDGFCLRCHDPSSLRGHETMGDRCTSCHDAHASARKYLLREGR
jgi:predicted CXXCH cytochrome family protein